MGRGGGRSLGERSAAVQVRCTNGADASLVFQLMALGFERKLRELVRTRVGVAAAALPLARGWHAVVCTLPCPSARVGWWLQPRAPTGLRCARWRNGMATSMSAAKLGRSVALALRVRVSSPSLSSYRHISLVYLRLFRHTYVQPDARTFCRISARSSRAQTALHYAARSGDELALLAVMTLISHGARFVGYFATDNVGWVRQWISHRRGCVQYAVCPRGLWADVSTRRRLVRSNEDSSVLALRWHGRRHAHCRTRDGSTG